VEFLSLFVKSLYALSIVEILKGEVTVLFYFILC